jgi:glycosyltransferase involved in cell wall biosynthesis
MMTVPSVVLRRSTVAAAGVRLSVVVPSCNTAKYLGDALDSVLAQTMEALEVIVVDDGSTDESVARALAYEDPRLTVAVQANHGLAATRNTGVALARAPLVGFCDADDVWYPTKAERQLAVMEADPSIGLTFSHSAYLDERGVPTGQLLVSRRRAPTAHDLARRNHVGNGSTPIARREALILAGLFDVGLRSCQDVEMWVRLAATTGLGIRLVPEVLTGYRIREGALTLSFEQFLRCGREITQRYRTLLPGFGEAAADRSYAQFLRIASRKAFAAGEVSRSRRYFVEALRLDPLLALRDPRAFALLGLHLLSLPLPERMRPGVYRAALRVTRLGFAVVLPRSSGATLPHPGADRN